MAKRRSTSKATGRKRRYKHIPWSEMKASYITGGAAVTFAGLGRKYGVHPRNVQRRAKLEDWRGERARFEGQVVAEAREMNAIELAGIARERFVEALDEFRAVRRLALSKALAQLNGADPELVEDRATQRLGGPGDGAHRTVRRRRVHPDSPLIRAILRLEGAYLAPLIKEADSEDEPPIRIE